MHPLLRAAADRRLGVFTAIDARRAGYDHAEIRRLCTSGRWTRLRRGIYIAADDLARAADPAARHRLECLAVLLHLGRPRAALSHGTAARIRDIPVPRALGPTIRLTDPDRWRRGDDFLMSRAPLRPGEVVTRGPLRLTSVARTLVDCAREWPLEDAVIAMDAALLGELVSVEELVQAAEAATTWPGARSAARAVALADGRAESVLETRGRLRILGAGLPAPQLQVEIWADGRMVAVVDAWFEDSAVAVEFDGRIKNTDPWRGRTPERVLWEEKRREDALRALDVRVVRVADDDLGSRCAAVEQRLGQLVTSPGPATRRFTTRPRVRGVRRSG
ncbi:type IV toxin-antitoxin system AbiEi family antitoxin domain-containing protein [Blastococcus sp. CCUG 61487]|uniref:type IV toxin-antitoxin system AbiEi family antitoxin domain-containing protein n=1 Tax=Blastococcus sp. CCUG 61487 TaxID=1840703 RepID=UPI0010C086EC|nr:type IV toxin-antitoxin system AbiEi family antitoxin domain-containing protein [Blastococcus sp. CCUG 61487]